MTEVTQSRFVAASRMFIAPKPALSKPAPSPSRGAIRIGAAPYAGRCRAVMMAGPGRLEMSAPAFRNLSTYAAALFVTAMLLVAAFAGAGA